MNETFAPPPATTTSCAASAALVERTLGRRRLLAIGAGTLGLGALATALPSVASAQAGYEAMLLMY